MNAFDERMQLPKIYLLLHESDHVFPFAYNALCESICLQVTELRRNVEIILAALAARRNLDPTLAADFCRLFTTTT